MLNIQFDMAELQNRCADQGVWGLGRLKSHRQDFQPEASRGASALQSPEGSSSH